MNADPRFQQADADAGAPRFAFDNSYARELEGAYVPWQPVPPPAPRLVRLNRELAAELGLDADALASPQGLAVLSGATVPAQAQPLAQAYAGHQFGGCACEPMSAATTLRTYSSMVRPSPWPLS